VLLLSGGVARETNIDVQRGGIFIARPINYLKISLSIGKAREESYTVASKRLDGPHDMVLHNTGPDFDHGASNRRIGDRR
jgi:hypothetical protein